MDEKGTASRQQTAGRLKIQFLGSINEAPRSSAPPSDELHSLRPAGGDLTKGTWATLTLINGLHL